MLYKLYSHYRISIITSSWRAIRNWQHYKY
nr:MAG TPA: hypothetical protein [Bacteriophage sp.]DAI57887.1 MAG TPA: hypothetical protein [Caudoviricetes sp.]